MREIIIGDRTIVVTHVGTETTEYGDIQNYRVDVSGADASTTLSILRASRTVDARVLAFVLDTELLLGYDGSAGHGLLRDSGVREWRDENRGLIEEVWEQLQSEIAQLPPEPAGDAERTLRRAFGLNETETGASVGDA